MAEISARFSYGPVGIVLAVLTNSYPLKYHGAKSTELPRTDKLSRYLLLKADVPNFSNNLPALTPD